MDEGPDPGWERGVTVADILAAFEDRVERDSMVHEVGRRAAGRLVSENDRRTRRPQVVGACFDAEVARLSALLRNTDEIEAAFVRWAS